MKAISSHVFTSKHVCMYIYMSMYYVLQIYVYIYYMCNVYIYKCYVPMIFMSMDECIIELSAFLHSLKLINLLSKKA